MMIYPIIMPISTGARGGSLNGHELGIVLIVMTVAVAYLIFLVWLSLDVFDRVWIVFAGTLLPLFILGLFLI